MDTKKLRQKILDLAIRGKLVPQDPNDEPASVLLERIRAEKEQLIKEGKIKRSKKSAASDTSHYENVPFEVPESWRWVNIMEVLVKLTDGTHHSPKNYPKGKYKYITAKNIKNEGIVLDGVTYVDDETHHEIFCRCNPEYGDILYIKDGATTGVVAINNLEEEFSLLSSVALLKPSKLISNKYLFYYLQSSYCYESVRSSMKGVGITRITLKQIADWDVPIPPMEEQHRIVEYIDSLFAQIDLIAKDTATLKLFLEKCKHSILNLAIAGKLVPQDPSDEPAIKPLTRINPSYKPCDNRHYRNVPKGWAVCTFGDILEYEQPQQYIVNSTDYSDEYEIPVLTAGKSFIIGKTNEKSGICKHLPVIIFDDFTTDLKYVDFPFKVKSSAMKILHAKGNVNPKYVAYLMSVTRLVGDTHKRYWISEYSKIPIMLPPVNEQERIVSLIEKIYDRLDKILAEL